VSAGIGIVLLEKPTYATAVASPDDFRITGSKASAGRRYFTWLTCAIACVSAWLASALSFMRTLITLRPSVDEEER